MGLDMYLTKKHYVKNWSHMDEKDRHQVLVMKGKPLDDGENLIVPKTALVSETEVATEKVKYVEEEVAYWRKANQIHNWFVENIQKGVDDCGSYWVPKEKLEELVDVCKQILATAQTNQPIPDSTGDWSEWSKLIVENPDDLEDLLPTASGFFFGNTDYDGDYLYGIKETIEQIEPYLEKDSEDRYVYGDSDFYYSSSW